MSVGATAAERKKWKAGSCLQVYVELDAEWYDGKIVQITGSGKYEKLVISYNSAVGKRKIRLPRNSKHLNVDIFNSEYNSDDTNGDDESSSSSSSDEDESESSSSSSTSSSSSSDSDSDSMQNRKNKKKKQQKKKKKRNIKKKGGNKTKYKGKSKSKHQKNGLTNKDDDCKDEADALSAVISSTTAFKLSDDRPKSKRAIAGYMKDKEDVLD